MPVIIGLHQVKYLENLAQVKRVVSAYGGGKILTTGPRIMNAYASAMRTRLPRELRMKEYDNAQVRVGTDSVTFDRVIVNDLYKPFTPIAVEVVDGAQTLPWFDHPESAMYVFGPEDGTLPSEVLRRCHAVVSIPTSTCLNLSHAVATVLYDRCMKNVIQA